MGTGGGRGRCGTDCHCVSAGCGMERAAHCCSTCRLCAGVSTAGVSCRPMARSWAARESRLDSAASRLSSPLPPSSEARAGAGAGAAAGPTGRFCMLAATTAATVGAPGLMPLAAAGAAAGPPSEGKASAGAGRAAGRMWQDVLSAQNACAQDQVSTAAQTQHKTR